MRNLDMQVMRFPTLLDDAEVDTAFVEFLQYVDNTYDLTLQADQCYAVKFPNS